MLALVLLGASPALLGAADLSTDFDTRVLAAHNAERALLGLQPLRWSEELAVGAEQWSSYLSQSGRFEHSPNRTGERIGENIWGGSAGRFPPERMVALWLAEKQYFKPGLFPNNSLTGSSRDVSHYTQVIWRDSGEVGCSISRGDKEDILVCRYKEPGNVIGSSPL